MFALVSTSSSRAAISESDPGDVMSATTVGLPSSVKPPAGTGSMRYVAVSAWSADAEVAHAPGPVIGSNGAAIEGEPAVGRIVCDAGESNRISPGATCAQVGAAKGPPDAAAFGQVCV